MSEPRQGDLFSGGGGEPAPAPDLTLWAPTDPVRLSDAALIAAIPHATQAEAAGLTGEAARRRLNGAIPALERLCRRFIGFGGDREIGEQTAALTALSSLGGKDAAEAVTRLIGAGAMRGPGLRCALDAAAALGCRLAPEQIAAALRDDDPVIRAAACRCARGHPAEIAGLIELLSDLRPDVARAAATALARMGRREGVGILLRWLYVDPSPEIVAALGPAADDDDAVRLGQIALAHPDLAPHVLAALDDCEAPRAAIVAQGVRRRLV
jgi:hypothetical protein